jgi:hypothetical protein
LDDDYALGAWRQVTVKDSANRLFSAEKGLFELRLDLESELVRLLGHPRLPSAASPAKATRALRARGVLDRETAAGVLDVVHLLDHAVHAGTAPRGAEALRTGAEDLLVTLRHLRRSAGARFVDHVQDTVQRAIPDIRVKNPASVRLYNGPLRRFDLVAGRVGAVDDTKHGSPELVFEVTPALTTERYSRLEALVSSVSDAYGPMTGVLLIAGDTSLSHPRKLLQSVRRDPEMPPPQILLWDRDLAEMPEVVTSLLHQIAHLRKLHK